MKGRALTPEAKKSVVERVLAAWLRKPELRLGQFLLNVSRNEGYQDADAGLFYCEDDALAEWAERYAPPGDWAFERPLLVKLIAERLPGAEVSVDEPEKADGHWFVDISLAGRKAVVEWRPGRGYGASLITEGESYGENPQARPESLVATVDWVVRALS